VYRRMVVVSVHCRSLAVLSNGWLWCGWSRALNGTKQVCVCLCACVCEVAVVVTLAVTVVVTAVVVVGRGRHTEQGGAWRTTTCNALVLLAPSSSLDPSVSVLASQIESRASMPTTEGFLSHYIEAWISS
jgi:hypothetical protein